MMDYESLITQDRKRSNWHLLSTYQMPHTLHTLYHLIPMRTKGGRAYLILQVRTIKLRKIHSFALSQISMWMGIHICPASCFSSLKKVTDSQLFFLPKHTWEIWTLTLVTEAHYSSDSEPTTGHVCAVGGHKGLSREL